MYQHWVLFLLFFSFIILRTGHAYKGELNPLSAEHFFENDQKFNEKKANLLTFCTYGTFLAPISSKCNGKSNPHIHSVYRWRESSKNRDFSRNGKIFVKYRKYPGSARKGLMSSAYFGNHMPIYNYRVASHFYKKIQEQFQNISSTLTCFSRTKKKGNFEILTSRI